MRRALFPVLTLAALLFCTGVADAAFPGQNGKIAFDRHDPGAQTVCIYIANADGSGQAPLLPCDSGRPESKPRWSPDGKQIAYEGSAGSLDLINADGSNLRPFFFESGISDISGHGWSPDGARLVVSWSFCGGGDGGCEGEIENIDAGTGAYFTILSAYPDKFFSDTDWSPDGSVIAFTQYAGTAAGRQLYAIHPDGTGGPTPLTTGSPGESFLPSWAPSGDKIAFVTNRDGNQEIYVMNADGTGQTRLTTNAAIDTSPAWSPDGTKILFQSWRDGNGEIYVMNANGSGLTNLTNSPAHESRPDWQPNPINAYPRPKGASPMQVSLVPAYEPCTVANRAHGPPLAFPSCAPPQRTPGQLTIGTADSNQRPTKSVSMVQIGVRPGIPSTPADEADLRLFGTVNDVRVASDLSDYTGQLEARMSVRITDKDNTPHPGGPGAGTVQDISYSFPIPCAATSDPTVGGDCTFETTAEAFMPGLVKELRRSVWELGSLRVYDGAGNLFMTQGIFAP